MPNNPSTYLIEPSLYFRNIDEFLYTINIFETVLDPNRLRSYFHEIKDISVDQLYDNSGKIKPAGSKSTIDDLDTIYGTVESWAGADGSNDATSKQPIVNNSKSVRLTNDIKREALKNKYKGFNDFPDEQKRPGVIAYFEVPKDGELSIDDWTNSWDPGFYIYDAKTRHWKYLGN